MKEIDAIKKEINRLENLKDKMEDEGNYDASIYSELDALYEKLDSLQNNIDNNEVEA